MPEQSRYHLVTLRRPQGGWGELQAMSANARRASEQISSEGMPVRFLRSIFVPDDEACFHLFEGSATAVAEASARAGIPIESIAESAEVTR